MCGMRNIKYYYRYVIVATTFLMLGCLMISPDVFSYTMVYMETANNTNVDNIRIYSSAEKNMLISYMAIGTLIGIYPFNWLFSRQGGHLVITAAGILSTVSTCLLPMCLDTSYALAIVIRIIQGISYSADFGLVGLVVTRWAPTTEIAFILAILSAFTVLKSAIALPVAGHMLTMYGWRSVHYTLGGISLFATLVWFIIYRDNPRDSLATNTEILLIQRGKAATDKHITVPYMHTRQEGILHVGTVLYIVVTWYGQRILTDVRVHAMWVAAFVDTTTSVMLMIFTAKFFDKIGFENKENAVMSSLPGYSFLVAKIITGVLSDRVKYFSEKTKIRFFNFLSLQVSAFVLLASALLLNKSTDAEVKETAVVQVVLHVIFQFFIGTNVGAFYKGGVMMSGEYAFFVIGNVQLFKSISVLVEPVLFNWIIPDNTWPQWTYFFYIHVGLLTLGNILYLPLVRAKPAAYVDVDRLSTREESEKEGSWRDGRKRGSYGSTVTVQVTEQSRL